MTESNPDPAAVIGRFLEAMNALDYDGIEAILAEDHVSEYPQSGEIIRGRSNFRAILENYPGGLPKGGVDRVVTRIIGSDDWAMTPTFTLVRLTGSGSLRTAIIRSRYPDGSIWWVINLMEIRDGRIAKATVYFAPMFDAPAWRAQWVEPRT